MEHSEFTLISHDLCPYVQRSVIVLTEKNIPHKRRYVDLSDKPDWFVDISPTGKVPVLQVGEGGDTLFESAVICEYLDEVTPGSLHSSDPLVKARCRSWIEFGSQLLNDIARLYNSKSEDEFGNQCRVISDKWRRLETVIGGDYFDGRRFGMVDAAYGPVFRYFDVMDAYLPFDVFQGVAKVRQWRHQLSQRPSVVAAVESDYPDRLLSFLKRRDSFISRLIQ